MVGGTRVKDDAQEVGDSEISRNRVGACACACVRVRGLGGT